MINIALSLVYIIVILVIDNNSRRPKYAHCNMGGLPYAKGQGCSSGI